MVSAAKRFGVKNLQSLCSLFFNVNQSAFELYLLSNKNLSTFLGSFISSSFEKKLANGHKHYVYMKVR